MKDEQRRGNEKKNQGTQRVSFTSPRTKTSNLAEAVALRVFMLTEG